MEMRRPLAVSTCSLVVCLSTATPQHCKPRVTGSWSDLEQWEASVLHLSLALRIPAPSGPHVMMEVMVRRKMVV